MAIVHHHPNGAEHVLVLYGEDGLWFHCLTAHDAPHDVTGEMEAHELTQWHSDQHAPGEQYTVADDDDNLVDPDLLADAVGPVPVEHFYLRHSCARCTELADATISPENAQAIREHALADHADQVLQ